MISIFNKLYRSHKAWGLLNKCVYNGSAFVITIVLSKVLPENEFGIYALAMSLFMMFAIVESFFQTATVKFCATADLSRFQSIVSNLLYLKILSIVIFCALLFGLRPMLTRVYPEAGLNDILLLFPAIFIFYTLHAHFSSVLRAQKLLKQLLVIQVLFSVIYIGMTLGLIEHIHNARHIFLIYLLAQGGTVIYAGFRYPNYILFQKQFHKPIMKDILYYGKFSVMIGVGGVIYQNMDMLMLGWLTDINDVGVYKIGRISATFVLTVTSGMLLTMLPEISQLDEEGRHIQIKNVYRRNIKILLSIFIPFFIVSLFFAQPLYSYFFQDKYAGASLIFIIFAATGIVRAIANPQGIILAGVGLIKFDSWQMILSLVLNIVLNLLLIPKYKAVGAAAATMASLILGAIIKEYVLRTKYFWKHNQPISLKGAHYET